MFIIFPDCQLTRRKRVHWVIDDKGDVSFSSADLSDCIRWLYDRGEMLAYVEITGQLNPWTIRHPDAE